MGWSYEQEDLQNRKRSGLQKICSQSYICLSHGANRYSSGNCGNDTLRVVDIKRRKRDTRRGIDLSNPVQLVDDAMEKWQQDWANSYKGRWPYRIKPSIGEWTKTKYGQVNYYLTQLLMGHGCYRAYLYKYGHEVDEACRECRNKRETAKHIFFTCSRCIDQRNCLERTIGFQLMSDYLK